MIAVLSDTTQCANVPVVGIVGGVGAGKSSIVRNVSDLRLFVIDADLIGHELLRTHDIRKKLKDAFGEEIFDEAGQVLRERLAEKVFGNAEGQKNDRCRLNEILHPAILHEIQICIKQVPQDVDAIILDAALLLEAGLAGECDAVVFIDTPANLRQQRVAAGRGWSVEELVRREASQLSLLEKRECSQFVVDNSGLPEAAAEQMKIVLKRIILERCNAGRR